MNADHPLFSVLEKFWDGVLILARDAREAREQGDNSRAQALDDAPAWRDLAPARQSVFMQFVFGQATDQPHPPGLGLIDAAVIALGCKVIEVTNSPFPPFGLN